MPSEYEALVAALKLTDIPFAEYGWNKRPEGTYGVVQLDFEAGSQDGDGEKQDRVWEASVDVFIRLIRERDDVISPLVAVALVSTAFAHESGSRISNQPKNDRANTTNNINKNIFVDMALSVSLPNRAVTISPRPR